MKNYKNPFISDVFRENPSKTKFWNVRKPPRADLQEYAGKYSISDIAFFYRTYDEVVQGWLKEDGIYHSELPPEPMSVIPPTESSDDAKKKAILKTVKPISETTYRVIRPSFDHEEDLEPDTIFPPTIKRPDIKSALEEEAQALEDEADEDTAVEAKTPKIKRYLETGETWEKPKIKFHSTESLFPPTGAISPTDKPTAQRIARILRIPYEERVYTPEIANVSIKDMLKNPDELGEKLSDAGGNMDVYRGTTKFANDSVYRELCHLLFVENMTTVDIARAWDVPYEQVKNLCKRYKISTRIYPTCGEYAKDHATMSYPALAEKYDITRITAMAWAKACGLRKEITTVLETYRAVLPDVIKAYRAGVEIEKIISDYGIESAQTLKNLIRVYNDSVDPADRVKRDVKVETGPKKPRQENLKDLKKELDTFSDEKLRELLEEHSTIERLAEHLNGTKAFLQRYLSLRNIQNVRKKKYPYSERLEELYIDNIQNIDDMFEAFKTDSELEKFGVMSDKGTVACLLGYFNDRKYVELVDITPENTYGILAVNYKNYAGDIGMVKCPAGQFEMGVNLEDVGYDEKFVASSPKHTVEISRDFWISETEVTQDLWDAVMGWNESPVRGSKLPVTNISQDDALVFCLKLNRLLTGRSGLILKEAESGKIGNHYNLYARAKSPHNRDTIICLPTSAEWEYAASSGGRDVMQVSSSRMFSNLGWSKDNASQIQKVAGKSANSWGLYDTLGNVNEWCIDTFDPEGYGRFAASVTVDPESKSYVKIRQDKYSSPQKRLNPLKIIRGGSIDDGFEGCHVALVKSQTLDELSPTTGFRFIMYLGE